jgi:hypothetical protein
MPSGSSSVPTVGTIVNVSGSSIRSGSGKVAIEASKEDKKKIYNAVA